MPKLPKRAAPPAVVVPGIETEAVAAAAPAQVQELADAIVAKVESMKASETFPERPAGEGAFNEVGPIIPASPAPPPAPNPALPLTVPPVDGQKVLIDGKVAGVAFAAGNKPIEAGVRSVALYAVKSRFQSPNVQFVRYPLERLYPAP